MIIPYQLQKDEFGFVKILNKKKIPIEFQWQLNPHNWKEAEIWLENGFNYGVLGGYGGLIVIDADRIEIKELIEKNFPETFTVKSGRITGNGRHYYYFSPEIKSKIVLQNQIRPKELTEKDKEEKFYGYGQISSYGTQTVGPESIHPDGNKYEVVKNLPIEKISREQLFSVLSEYLPEIIFEKESTNQVNNDKIDGEWRKADELDILSVLKIFGLPIDFRGRQLQISHPIHGSEGGGNFVVHPEKNAWYCFRHNSGGGPMNLIAVLEGIIDCSEALKGKLQKGLFLDVKKIAQSKYGLRDNFQIKSTFSSISNEKYQGEIYVQLKKDFHYIDEKTGKKKVSPFGIQNIANYFVENYHIKTMGGERNREIYLYENGIYKQEGSNFFKSELEKILQEDWNIHWQSEIVEKIKNLSYVKREDFEVEKNFINLKNGIYNLKTRELLKHDPKYFFLYQIPVNYNPIAECPKILKFFNETFEEKDIPVIQEWIGFALYRDYFIKKALIIFGLGNTGKSTFAGILTKFIGKLNISDVPLQEINDRFTSTSLYNKHLNICDDLSATDVSENGPFKMATGRSLMSGEYKFGDRFTFINYAKLTFTCNKIPAPKDTDDDAYFSRWMLINLQKPVEQEKIDNSLLDKILTEEELSGLLNFALIGLDNLLINGKFSYKKETDEVKIEMLKSGSSIAEFAYTCLEKEIGNFISSEKLYNNYVNFANENELSTETEQLFGRDLPKYVGYVAKGWGTEIVKRVKGWRNIKFKESLIF